MRERERERDGDYEQKRGGETLRGNRHVLCHEEKTTGTQRKGIEKREGGKRCCAKAFMRKWYIGVYQALPSTRCSMKALACAGCGYL